MLSAMVVGIPDRAKHRSPLREGSAALGMGSALNVEMCCAHVCAVLLCCHHMPLWFLLWLLRMSTNFILAILQTATAALKLADLFPTCNVLV